jgi:hypothetical protein
MFNRHKQGRADQLEAANAEIGGLCALPVADLAVEVLPAFGQRGILWTDTSAVAKWLMAAYSERPSLLSLEGPIEEACQALEQAGLLLRVIHRHAATAGSHLELTRLGHTALAEGTVRQYLPEYAGQTVVGNPDVPPEVVALARSGKRANAAIRYRQLTGADVKRALEVVDSL